MLEVKRKPSSHSHGASTTRARISTDRDPSSLGNVFRQATNTPVAPTTSSRETREFQAKLPVITGEVYFKGVVPVDGVLSGQIGVSGSLTLKQRSSPTPQPELTGEITFRDMVRVNGHVAGTIYSQKGTLIVDTSARVEANVDVAVVIVAGTVRGDIVAQERVELGPASKIYGNIWTRSLVIKDGAIFEGVCRMIGEVKTAG